MLLALAEIASLSDPSVELGRELYEGCRASLFPCDVLALAVLDRSLSLIKGFTVLLKNGGYIPSVGLLRMQLDNVLRFNGIVSTNDPHGVANQVINGVALRKIEDNGKKKMTDARLRELMSAENPWINHVYELSSSYIHLSNQHVLHVLQRSEPDQSGSRQISIGDEDEYLREDQRMDLVNTFAVVTRGVQTVVKHWVDHRASFGETSALQRRFKGAV